MSSRGKKRICASCQAKFYDLNKDPVICPKCGTLHNLTASGTPPAKAPEPEEKDDIDDLVKEDEDDGAVTHNGSDDILEDASDLTEDESDLDEVMEHVETPDKEG